MILKIRQRMARDESGFTLVELLVVMLILGLLAAIAIPAFFNQRNKAKDASAKEAARTAETAVETFATDNGGSYANATPAALQNIESTLNGANLTVPTHTAHHVQGHCDVDHREHVQHRPGRKRHDRAVVHACEHGRLSGINCHHRARRRLGQRLIRS